MNIYICMRGAVVEWLKRLDYGAEGRRKVVSPRLGFVENSHCQPSSEWKLRKAKAKAAKGEGWALPCISCAQDTVGL